MTTLHIPVTTLRLHTPPASWAQVVALLHKVFGGAEPPVLAQLVAQLSTTLRDEAASLSNQDVSAIMRFIADADERREEAELVTNPARRAGIERAGQRIAARTM